MKRIEYDDNAGNIDPFLRNLIQKKREQIANENDDTVVLLIGDTGSGKSQLSLNMMQEYMGDERTEIDLIGLCRPTIAKAVQTVKNIPKPRCALFDEANINKRDSLSKFNKDVMDLFMAIRGLNIFWLWCNPSANMMDKFFIEERISAIIYVKKQTVGEGEHQRRVFYFFKTKKILQILEKYGNLKTKTLNKVKKKYAFFRGWFKLYDGKLKESYEEKKQERMKDKSDEFCEKYGEFDKTFPKTVIARKVDVSTASITRYFEVLRERGDMIEGTDYHATGGVIKFFESSVPKFIAFKEEMHRNMATNKQNETEA